MSFFAYRLEQIVGLPQYVKEASVDGPSSEHPRYYADPATRKYPIHNKAATWLSYARYIYDVQAGMTKASTVTEDRFMRSAQLWGIMADCIAAAHSIKKQATAKIPTDEDYALIAEDEDGKVALFPMRDTDEIKQAAVDLYTNRGNLPYEWRHQAASRILDKAKAADCQVPHEDYLRKAAGEVPASHAAIADALTKRAHMYLNTAAVERCKELAKLASSTNVDAGEVAKTACMVVDRLDRLSGIHHYYARSRPVPTPEELCYTKKAATEPVLNIDTGVSIPVRIIKELPAERLGVISKQAAQQVCGLDGKIQPEKLAQLLPTLTSAQKAILSKVLR